ncbi:MAG: FAD-dependent monooxygenase [Chloroflexota bacterium]
MSGRSVDVLVVGGGLAGCAAAMTLARRGARVVVAERLAYPHDKVCGEFLSPECADRFGQLGVSERVAALRPPALDAAVLSSPGGVIWTARFDRPGMGISRRALDALLADAARAAGADVCERAVVTGISGNLDAGFEASIRAGAGEQRWKARVVIGAHGKRSSFDRALGRRFLRVRQPFVGLKAYFDGPPLAGQVHLHAFPGGYCGLAPVETGHTNVCLLVRQAQFAAAAGPRGDIESFVRWMARQNVLLGDWLGSARRVSERWLSISQVPFMPKPALDGDVLMAGDAAGMIAPLAGNGMSMALDAGMMAADYSAALLDARLTPSDVRRGYADAWRRRFGNRLRLGRALQAALLRPWLLEPGLRFLRLAPLVGELLVTHTRDLNMNGHIGSVL